MIDREEIVKYAKRNTSIKMPVEQKFVSAWLDGFLNCDSMESVYKTLRTKAWNEDYFIGLISYWKDCSDFIEEPYRSIIAYSMLKKDEILFQIICNAFFTGIFQVYLSDELSGNVIETTDQEDIADEFLVTDIEYTTDMTYGLSRLGFKNFYSVDKFAGTNKYTYMEYEKYLENLERFYSFITIVKPARCGLIVFHIPVIELNIPTKSAYSCDTIHLSSNFTFNKNNYESFKIYEYTGDDYTAQGGVELEIVNFSNTDSEKIKVYYGTSTVRVSYLVKYIPESLSDNIIDHVKFFTSNSNAFAFDIKKVIKEELTNIYMFRIDVVQKLDKWGS